MAARAEQGGGHTFQLTGDLIDRLYYDDPVAFVEDMLLQRPPREGEEGIQPRLDEYGQPLTVSTKQAETLRLIASGKWPLVYAARGVGKTALCAWVVIWWLYTRPTGRIITTSVKVAQLEISLWPELKLWVGESLLAPDFEWQKTKFFLKTREEENFAVMQTGVTPESLHTTHDPYLLVIVDEASFIEEAPFNALMGALTGRYNILLSVGNPTRSTGPFYRLIRKPFDPFVPVRIPGVNPDGSLHPLMSPILESSIREQHGGTESNAYRVYIRGEFPLVDDNQVIAWELVEEAAELDLPVNYEYREIWGVDVARFGSDRSALARRRGPVLRDVRFWQGLDTMQLVGRITHEVFELAEEEWPSEVIVDDIGVGGGVVDRLRETLPAAIMVRPCNVTRLPAVKAGYHRLRDELWWKMAEWFKSRAVSIPQRSDTQPHYGDLAEELTAPRYNLGSDGRIHVESKADFRKRLDGNSPDLADAMMLTFAAGLELIQHSRGDRYTRAARARKNKRRSWMAA